MSSRFALAAAALGLTVVAIGCAGQGTPGSSGPDAIAAATQPAATQPLVFVEPPESGEAKALRLVAWGETKELELAGVKLAELSPAFDLNPLLAKDRAYRQEHGLGLVTTQVAVEISRLAAGTEVAYVEATPLWRVREGTGLLAAYTLRDAGEGRPAKLHEEKMLISKRGSNAVTMFILGQDGRPKATLDRGWAVVVAVAGERGVVCWNDAGQDKVLGDYPAGYRRFKIEGPATKSDLTGWRFFIPVVGE